MDKKIKKALKKTKELEKKDIPTKKELKEENKFFDKLAKGLPKLLKGNFAKRKKR